LATFSIDSYNAVRKERRPTSWLRPLARTVFMTQAHTSSESRPVRGLPPLEAKTPMEERASLLRRMARRRWVFRMTILLALTAVALCFFVAWKRDQTVIDARLQLLAGPMAQLQDQVNQLGWLPAQSPELGNEAFTYYVTDAVRHYVYQTSDPVIVAVTVPVQLVLKADGRAVIIYHKKKLEAKWLSVTRFEKAWDQQEKQIKEFEQQRQAQPIDLP
jgi:hypothetical protein